MENAFLQALDFNFCNLTIKKLQSEVWMLHSFRFVSHFISYDISNAAVEKCETVV